MGVGVGVEMQKNGIFGAGGGDGGRIEDQGAGRYHVRTKEDDKGG